jgi:hypothetical protein
MTAEKTLSKAAVEKVIQDQIEWWQNELSTAQLQLIQMEQRYKNYTCTLDGLILYKKSYDERVADIQTRLVELDTIMKAIDRLG